MTTPTEEDEWQKRTSTRPDATAHQAAPPGGSARVARSSRFPAGDTPAGTATLSRRPDAPDAVSAWVSAQQAPYRPRSERDRDGWTDHQGGRVRHAVAGGLLPGRLRTLLVSGGDHRHRPRRTDPAIRRFGCHHISRRERCERPLARERRDRAHPGSGTPLPGDVHRRSARVRRCRLIPRDPASGPERPERGRDRLSGWAREQSPSRAAAHTDQRR